MISYSIAIRTIGTAGDKFRRELESIYRQTLQPDKVLVYIAEGGKLPDFKIGKEEYVWVKKGMVAQRALCYKDIDSDVLFFLDDDVELAPDSAKKMLDMMECHSADAVGADVFQNHKMSLRNKGKAMITNLVIPHWNKEWAFKVKKSGSFSYLLEANNDFYWSQCCGGPAWMIKKKVYNALSMSDEKWLDKLGFAYGDDQLETYKIFKNGYKLGVIFNSGIINLDGGTSSGIYKNDKNRIYIRTKASFAIWWRSIFKTVSGIEKSKCVLSFGIKSLWLLLLFSLLSLIKFSPSFLILYIRGLFDGYTMVHSSEFKKIPSYSIMRSK